MLKLDTVMAVGGYEEAAGVARRAEEMGFAGIFTAEAMQTPFLPLAVASTDTERIELGTAIAVAFPRSPMVHAMTAWDLHKGSKGRFILGLGTQIKKHNERRFSVEYDHPGPRLKDMILAIRHIWDAFDGKHKLDYHGEFFTHDYITPFFNPGPTGYGQPKIFIAAVGPWMCRMAGEVCDGIHIHPFHTVEYIEEVVKPNVREGLAKVGRSEDDFEYATTAFVLVGDEAQQAGMGMMARNQIAFYGSTPAYRAVFELHGLGHIQPELQGLMREGKMGEMADVITDDVLDLFAIRSDFDGLADALRAKYDGVVGRLGFYMPVVGSGQEDKWEPIVKEFAS
ncbi:MAG: TIGR03617 family F420-dependent LLM class oxidoreductase [Actinobacteria bacterium ATB1]|nr:TIGR03617 family F420-dependent LLM class oxidoreductase [Actinobacteria bacterium ATB1]